MTCMRDLIVAKIAGRRSRGTTHLQSKFGNELTRECACAPGREIEYTVEVLDRKQQYAHQMR